MSLQKKLAAKIMKCSEKKIWIDPKNEKVKQAITRRDVRRFIKEGIIKKNPGKKQDALRVTNQQRTGSIKGSRGARLGKKSSWLKVIRPQRRMLNDLREKKQLKPGVYRKLYGMVKGNAFRSKAHLTTYLKDNDFLEDGKK
jgi:large subunit ribosomal protein L19e